MTPELVCAILTAACLYLQDGAPQPSPAHERLQAYIGNWTYQGEVNETPLTPAAEWTGSHTFEWFPGGFFVVHRWKDTNDRGVVEEGIEMIGYDSDKKLYTLHAFTSLGEADANTFKWIGDRLKITDSPLHYHGKSGIERCAGTFTETTTTIDCQVSLDKKKTWLPESHGVWTKHK